MRGTSGRGAVHKWHGTEFDQGIPALVVLTGFVSLAETSRVHRCTPVRGAQGRTVPFTFKWDGTIARVVCAVQHCRFREDSRTGPPVPIR